VTSAGCDSKGRVGDELAAKARVMRRLAEHFTRRGFIGGGRPGSVRLDIGPGDDLRGRRDPPERGGSIRTSDLAGRAGAPGLGVGETAG
jgi:hypothetical protein